MMFSRKSPWVILWLAIFITVSHNVVLGSISVAEKSFTSNPATFGRVLKPDIEYKAHMQFLSSDQFMCEPPPMTAVRSRLRDSRVPQKFKPPLESSLNFSSPEDFVNPHDGTPVVLLVSRGKCSFEDKARAAMTIAKVEYLVIFDDRTRSDLVTMSASEPDSINIGLLFISLRSAKELKNLILNQTAEIATAGGMIITMEGISSVPPDYDSEMKQWMLAALSVFFTLTACVGCLLICLHTGLIHRDGDFIILGRFPAQQSSQPQLLTKEQVMELPESIYLIPNYDAAFSTRTIALDEEDSNSLTVENAQHQSTAVCVICIDEYKVGEKLRVLPCSHTFHTECIVPWLTERHSSCPLCKYNINNKIENENVAEGDQEERNCIMSLLWGLPSWFRRLRRGNDSVTSENLDLLRRPFLSNPQSIAGASSHGADTS